MTQKDYTRFNVEKTLNGGNNHGTKVQNQSTIKKEIQHKVQVLLLDILEICRDM